jgi:hypothetical protein
MWFALVGLRRRVVFNQRRSTKLIQPKKKCSAFEVARRKKKLVM